MAAETFQNRAALFVAADGAVVSRATRQLSAATNSAENPWVSLNG